MNVASFLPLLARQKSHLTTCDQAFVCAYVIFKPIDIASDTASSSNVGSEEEAIVFSGGKAAAALAAATEGVFAAAHFFAVGRRLDRGC